MKQVKQSLLCQVKCTRSTLAALFALAALTLSFAAQAQTWNAFNDFYVNVPAPGGFPQSAWTENVGVYPGVTGLTAPNAWGYAGGNFNGGAGIPSSVGTYLPASGGLVYPLTSGGTYAGPGASYLTGGVSFWIGYNDQYNIIEGLPGALTQIGKYTSDWFVGAPNYASNPGGANTKYLWLQGTGLSPGTDGLGAMLTWTAPSSGTFQITGSYVNGNYGQSTSFAIVDSRGNTLLSRQVLAPSSTGSTFTFTKTYTAGDVIQFQAGTPAAAQGSPLGLAVNIVKITTTNWNAARDFYLSPTASGWTGATIPSEAGTAWGYYYANVNANGFPSQIGQYFTTAAQPSVSRPFLYKYSDISPLGGSFGREASSGYVAAGGANLGYYSDSYGLGSSLGRFDTSWDPPTPGYSTEPRGGIWMQAGWLGVKDVEGIVPVVTWTAPYSGIYDFKGSFQAGINGSDAANGASIAIVASTGTAPMERTVATQGMDQPFAFRRSLNQGDVIQFQVGTGAKTGTAVGLNADVTRVGDFNQKVPSSVNLAESGTLAYTGSGVSPALAILGSTTAPTYSYKGVDGTSYGPSSSAPTNQGRYEVTVTTADDSTWSGTTNKFYYSVGTFNAFKDFWWNRTNGQAAWINPSNALAQGRSQGTPTSKNTWGYGLIRSTTNLITDPEVNTTFQSLSGYSYDSNNPSWTYHNGDINGTRVSWIATNSNNAVLALAPSAGAVGGDGLAAAVRWTAPAAGTYRFKGDFVSQGANSMSVAIQTLGDPYLPDNTNFLDRTNVAAGASRSFDVVRTVVDNQTVTWVVGSNGDSTGDLMLLSANVTQVIPSTISSNPTASFITAGQALSNSIISGGSVTPGGGTWAWVDPSNVFSTPGTYSVEAVYTPALSDQPYYQSVTASLSLTVNAATPAGPTFAGAYPGKSLSEVAPNGLSYLMNYALGGNSATPTKLPVQDLTDTTKLTIYAFVRTNDNTVTVVGETSATLTNWNTNTPVVGIRTTDQAGAPDGTERRAFTVNASGDRLFLRLKAIQ